MMLVGEVISCGHETIMNFTVEHSGISKHLTNRTISVRLAPYAKLKQRRAGAEYILVEVEEWVE